MNRYEQLVNKRKKEPKKEKKERDIETRITQRELLPVSTSINN